MTIEGNAKAASPMDVMQKEEVDVSKIEEYISTKIINIAISENDEIALLKDRVEIEEIIPPDSSVAESSYTVQVRVDLSQLPTLTEKTDFLKNNDLVSTYLNELFYELNVSGSEVTPKIDFTITSVNISQNNISGRSLLQNHSDLVNTVSEDAKHSAFKGIDPTLSYLSHSELNRSMYDETKQSIAYVDYSHTNITFRGLKYMFRLPSLRSLKMDYCPKATYIQNPSYQPCTTIRVVSLLGAALCSAKDVLKDLETKFPNIERVDLTQQQYDGRDHKFVGLLDISSQQSTWSPHALVPCGHIFGRVNAGKQLSGGCWLCRQTATKIVDASIFQTRLDKSGSTWKVQVLDFHRKPISSPTLFHPKCRQAFNPDTIAELFKIFVDKLSSTAVIEALADETCPGCLLQGRTTKMELMTIYPTATEKDDELADSQLQESLFNMGTYTQVN